MHRKCRLELQDCKPFYLKSRLIYTISYLSPNNTSCQLWWWCLVTKSRLTLCDPMNCNPPGSPVHGILQVRTLEGGAMPSSRGSSWPRDPTQEPNPGLLHLLHWQTGPSPREPPGKPRTHLHPLFFRLSPHAVITEGPVLLWSKSVICDHGQRHAGGKSEALDLGWADWSEHQLRHLMAGCTMEIISRLTRCFENYRQHLWNAGHTEGSNEVVAIITKSSWVKVVLISWAE